MQKKITKRVMGKIFAINVVLITLISLSLFNNTYAETIQTAKTKPKVITKEEAENSKKILELKSLNIEIRIKIVKYWKLWILSRV